MDHIANIPFPVYGIVGEPLGLQLHGAAPHLGIQGVTLGYRSTLYRAYTAGRHPIPTFRILSDDATIFPLQGRDAYLEYVIAAQEQPVRDPFRWEGSLIIADTLFSGTITYYAAPLLIAGFRLTSEKTLISGYSCGPSCDELMLLLEGLRVLDPL